MRSFTRRTVLQAGGACCATASLAGMPAIGWGAADKPVRLRAAPGFQAALLDDDPAKTEVWTYNRSVPGPVLRVKRGSEVSILFENGLTQPSSIHWHGIRIDNAMDGVPHLTQAPVAPGETFHYRFTVPDAGTFWYHPHLMTSEQLGRGLYGMLIVEDPSPPYADRDEVLVIDDWLLDDAGQIMPTFGNVADAAHGGRLGNVATINGAPTMKLAGRVNDRLRLRLCNVANARIMGLRFTDHIPTIIAIDGQPVSPHPADNGIITLVPAQRCDIMLDLHLASGGSFPIHLITSDTEINIGTLSYARADDGRADPLPPPVQLPANIDAAPADPAAARQVNLRMEGGAMGQMMGGKVGDMAHDVPDAFLGKTLDMKGMIQAGQVWTFNGVAGMSHQPLFSATRGETVVLTMTNDTRWPHAIHLHGHHFRELRSDGTINPVWRDTVLIDAAQSMRVVLVVDNPGKWMLHCHMVEHQAAGMGTWFHVL